MRACDPLVTGLRHNCDHCAEKLAVICGDLSWTYGEFDRLTDFVAGHLLCAGIRPGDRVAFHLLNVPELALGYVGCLKAGAIAVPVNTRLKAREIEYVLRHSGTVCYIGQPSFYSEVVGLRKQLEELRLTYLTGDGATENGVRPFEELLQPLPTPVSLPAIAADQAAAILYTSGTTAHPKGVTHSHETLAQIARAMRGLHVDENQTVIVITSMAHMVGFGMLFLASLLNKATVVLLPRIEPLAVLQAIQRYRCSCTFGLPTQFLALAQTQSAAPHDVSSGRFYFCGGDSVSPALQEAFERSMGQGVCEAYGGTEAVPLTYNRPGHVRVGSIGQAAEGVRMRLLDSEDRDVALGEVGEICIQSAVLMIGYWNDPEATTKATRDGWFHTGDLARCDAEGYYWFAGRTKQIIIRGGSNISPQEVESVLLEHDLVGEAAVIGRPDRVWGEIVVAYVVLRAGQSLTEEELIAFARARMAVYKTPEHVIFLDALPKTATGKLDRRALREAEQAGANL
jgi:long-chain acyl-CoA synthetase